MLTSLPDLSKPIWDEKLSGLLECASLAIGRLDARLSSSQARAAWLERATWSGFAAARRAQGAELGEIDIFALACDASLPGRRSIAFAADERTALVAWQRSLGSAARRHWREIIPLTIDVPEDWRERPALLRALELTARHARADQSDRPWLDSPALLASLGLTATPLPGLVVADKALRLAPRDMKAILPRFFKEMTRAAQSGLERLKALESDRLRAAHVVAAAGRPGALLALTVLLQRRPLVSPMQVAGLLGLTKSGAGKLLARAADAGLLFEISRREAWKLYLTPDLARAFGYVARPLGRPVTRPAPEPLSPVLARFDAEMAAFAERYPDLARVAFTGTDDEE